MATPDDLDARLEAGWAALSAGHWEEAREVFATAAAEETSAAACEGLSWATWWLDDGEASLRAREQAFQLYREAGDPRSAARMAAWIAADQVDFHGAIATARGWIARGRRLLAEEEPGPDHGWLAMHEGYIASLEGDEHTAARRGQETAELGRTFQVPDLEMLGLALQGSALVARGEVGDGMPCLDEASAIALAGEAQIPMSCAWTCCLLVTACTKVLDYDRAREWSGRIEDFAERWGSRYMLGFCRAEYAAVYLWRGRWAEAEQALRESMKAFQRARPGMVGWPKVALAELWRRCGYHDAVEQALDGAGGSSAQIVLANLALDRGDLESAAELGDRILRGTAPEKVFDRVPPLEILVRTRAAGADLEAADGLLDQLQTVARLAGTTGMAARVDQLAGVIAAARGDHESARGHLTDAVDAFARSEAPYETARARLDLARTLEALGEDASGRAEKTRAHDTLSKLRAAVPDPHGPAAGQSFAPPVSPRELEVLATLAEGLTNRQIAKRLTISEHTVHRHVNNILRKLEVPSRAAAAAHAVREGWVQG